MEKLKRIIQKINTPALLLLAYVIVACVYSMTPWGFFSGESLKFLAYFCGIIYITGLFSRISERITTVWHKYSIAVALATAFAGINFCYITLLHYLNCNISFFYPKSGSLLPISFFLSKEFLETDPFGKYRYLMIFAVCMIAFVGVIHLKKHEPWFMKDDLVITITIEPDKDTED